MSGIDWHVTEPVPLPGDFAVCSIAGQAGALISAMERLGYGHATRWDHAFIYMGSGQIVQAEPGGAVLAALGTPACLLWSTGIIPLTGPQRSAICEAAAGYAERHTGYSWLDYGAIAAHRFHLPAPGLKGFIASTGHMICSQLVDECYQDAGVHLFQDGRWPGFVAPFDLARVALGAVDA